MQTVTDVKDGATAVITAHVREGHVEDYENWLNEIQPVCRSYPGFLDSQVIRPIAGLTRTFTFVIRFDTIANLRNWLESKDRKRLIEKGRLLMLHDDNYKIQSGLEFWFTPATNDVKVPARWKQCLLTWTAIFPLVIVVPLVLNPPLRLAAISETGLFATLVGTVVICVLMTYVVMPPYTKMMRKWLYGERD